MDTPEYPPRAFPVSIKGVVVRDGRVLLLKNERDEWELPGGKLEIGEEPESCVAREITEEIGWKGTTGPSRDRGLNHTWQAGAPALTVRSGCHVESDAPPPVLSDEHRGVGLFTESEVLGLAMPEGYKRSIASWFSRLRSDGAR